MSLPLPWRRSRGVIERRSRNFVERRSRGLSPRKLTAVALPVAAALLVPLTGPVTSAAAATSVPADAVVAVGTMQSEAGCTDDWQPDCLATRMTSDGGSLYTFTEDLAAGSYAWKVAIGGSWAENYGLEGGKDAGNLSFTLTKPGPVTFTWNSDTQRPAARIGVPSHDDNVEWDGLAHDSRSDAYRVPGGAVNPGTKVTLRFRTFHNDVTGVTARLYDTGTSRETRTPMTTVATAVPCLDAALDGKGATCDWWQTAYTPSALGTVYYRFIANDGPTTAYYADNAGRFGGVGRITSDEVDDGYRIHVVDPTFQVVPWMRDGVMYQVFPDRFYNGDPGNDPASTDFRYDYPAPANATPAQQQAAKDAQIQLRQWTQLPEGSCAKWTPTTGSPACTETPKGRDYFGGDLQGVTQKLDYLKGLGVTVVYLNPIFDSGSNHGYDTRNYQQVSAYFGGNAAFKQLVKQADKRGMRIILDGVFNHLSSDSPFFDRYHHYSDEGACESVNSDYRSWFTFHDVKEGTGVCVNSKGVPNSATYDSWAGFDSIPAITKRADTSDGVKKDVADYFYRSSDSVAQRWLRDGASGWRFDVMTDGSFPAAYWQQLRMITKGIKPDETLIAEAWHWYDNLPLTNGDTADTAMGYRFRAATLSLLGAKDDKGFPDENRTDVPVSQFAAAMESMREDYADATYYTFMNLLDSHDTKRVLWSLTPGEDNRQDKEFNDTNVAVGKAKEAIASVLQFTVPGTPTVYYGDEVSLTGADDPDDRRPFPWRTRAGHLAAPNNAPYYGAEGDHATLDRYRRLTALRKQTPVLRTGALTFLGTNDTDQTLSYAMHGKDGLAVVLVNRNESSSKAVQAVGGDTIRPNVRFTAKFGTSGQFVTNGKGELVNADGSPLTLPALSAAVLVADAGQDLTGPAPVASLKAKAGNGSVDLTWTGTNDAVAYRVLRSPLAGGGYTVVTTTTATSWTDGNARNGQAWHYVVRAVDKAGNVGARSAEASATPSLPIGWANVQYPQAFETPLTSEYQPVYGQVYVSGLTDAGGSPSAVVAELGVGPQGSASNAAAAMTWTPMTFNVKAGNNFEYQGRFRAEQPGTYEYLTRYSTDGGLTWTYGDTKDDANDPGDTDTSYPGIAMVTPSSDTTAPGAPTASIDWSARSLTVSWTPPGDTDVAEYRVYRGDSSDSSTPTTLVGTVNQDARTYVDDSVSAGQAYRYVVRAYDTSLNASAPSNVVSHVVEAKTVQVTFRVSVPDYTPATDTVYITGQSTGVSPDPLCGYCGGNASTAMTRQSDGMWAITLPIPDGTAIEYKYTRGSYDNVEEWGSIAGLTNRTMTVHANSSSDLTELVADTAGSDDNHKAVANWRDALIASATATSTAVTLTGNWGLTAVDGVDVSTAVTVTSPTGQAVSGSAAIASGKLVFTPTTSLPAGSYNVSVAAGSVSVKNQQNDGKPLRATWSGSVTVPAAG